ncbi:helix-turn-helix domain-containing protein [Massilia orientalis]|uniref:Helix-turn-helix domain-containing protein n=1 Tax=Massilia orientalis TaxID=3050128 RepID=A0ACC7MKW9_9BURK|nr:AraC family transcriptional regulator [Massilia sp. YIM B02787]
MHTYPHTSVVTARWKTQTGTADQRLLASVRKLLEERANQQATLAEIADELLLSPRTLRRRLLELNTRFSTLVAEVRGDQVRRYLTETSWSLDRIAEEVGYSDAANLRQAVKRWTGESPQGFRLRMRSQQNAQLCERNFEHQAAHGSR